MNDAVNSSNRNPPNINNLPPTNSKGGVNTNMEIPSIGFSNQDFLTRFEDDQLEDEMNHAFSAADNPIVPAPREQLACIGEKELMDISKTNPWFHPSYLGVFIAIMTEILQLERINQFNEAQIERDSRGRMVDMAKNMSTLTKLLYQNQAQEKFIEAMSCFLSAGISTGQLVDTIRNYGRASQEVNKDITDKTNEIKALEDKIKSGHGVFDPPQNPTQQQLTDFHNKQDAILKNPQPNEPLHIAKARTDLATAKQDLAKMENSLHKADAIRQKEYQMNQLSQLRGDIMKQIVQGTTSSITGIIKLEEGRIDALKQLLEGYNQALHKFNELATRAAESAATRVDKTTETITQTVRTGFQAQHYR